MIERLIILTLMLSILAVAVLAIGALVFDWRRARAAPPREHPEPLNFFAAGPVIRRCALCGHTENEHWTAGRAGRSTACNGAPGKGPLQARCSCASFQETWPNPPIPPGMR